MVPPYSLTNSWFQGARAPQEEQGWPAQPGAWLLKRRRAGCRV